MNKRPWGNITGGAAWPSALYDGLNKLIPYNDFDILGTALWALTGTRSWTSTNCLVSSKELGQPSMTSQHLHH
jgi:hypothetical protein